MHAPRLAGGSDQDVANASCGLGTCARSLYFYSHGIVWFTLGCSESSLSQALACAVLESGRMLVQHFGRVLRQRAEHNDYSLVALIRFGSYDETPTHLRTKQKSQSLQKPLHNSARPQISKLFQSSGMMSALIQDKIGRILCVELPVPSSVQVMDYATAECMNECLRRMWHPFDDLAAHFDTVVNIDVHDRAAANLRYEDSRRLLGGEVCGRVFVCGSRCV
jgi:hypothetical protein